MVSPFEVVGSCSDSREQRRGAGSASASGPRQLAPNFVSDNAARGAAACRYSRALLVNEQIRLLTRAVALP